MRSFHQGVMTTLLGLAISHAAWADTGDSGTAASPDAAAAPQATVEAPKPTPRLEDSTRLFHLVATAGLSVGGDTVATAYYTNGDAEDIKAGGLFYVAGGVGLDIPNMPLTLQALGGYHVNDSTAENGKMTFDRTTLDAQLFYRNGNHRFGVGLVQHSSPEFVGKVDGHPDVRIGFDDASGMSLEYDYLPAVVNWPFKESRLGFSVRYVKIDYEAKTYNGQPVTGKQTVSGNHGAVGLYLYL